MPGPHRAGAIRRLPISNDFDVAPSGETTSIQCLDLPADWLAAPPLDERLARRLGPFYFRRLEKISLGLIRVQEESERIRFELALLGLPLLIFAPVRIEVTAQGVRACYPIVGGLTLVREPPTEGTLCLSARQKGAALRLGMAVEGYYPRLRGTRRDDWLRRQLYSRTQAALHHLIARDYLRQVARALCSQGEI